jgi:phage replication-related protein YjqB (UPF0714/DUF867 family)
MSDKYSSYRMLRASEPRDSYRVIARPAASRFAVVAPHAGAIEPGTSEISRAIAGNDLALYLFEGMKDRGNRDLHVTSSRFDEPRCLALLAQVEIALAIHGERSDEEAVFLGGRHIELRELLRDSLEAAGFQVEIHPSIALQGTDPENICNKGTAGRGAQLELSAGLRRAFFGSLAPAARTSPTARMCIFHDAVRRALLALD